MCPVLFMYRLSPSLYVSWHMSNHVGIYILCIQTPIPML